MKKIININSKQTHILAVDDESTIRNLLSEIITSEGYMCSTAESTEEALKLLETESFDVIITDLSMPGLGGMKLLEIVKEKYDSDVIVMTGFIEDFSYEKIIKKGASDLLHKPTPYKEIILRLKRVLHEREILAEMNRTHVELKEAYLDTINRLVLAAEHKDEDTGDHIIRISNYCAFIAEKLGLDEQEVQNIRYASPMHDMGKIGIPDNILLKRSTLTNAEFEIIKSHTIIGYKILDNPKSDILNCGRQVAVSHHEKWNGKGYPYGLAGEDIYLSGRIVCIADVFDALTSVRPYKNPYPIEVAVDIIRKDREQNFDPDITDIFLDNIDEIIKIKEATSPGTEQAIGDFVWSERDKEDGTCQAVTDLNKQKNKNTA
jgi:putative two-component system response regulator